MRAHGTWLNWFELMLVFVCGCGCGCGCCCCPMMFLEIGRCWSMLAVVCRWLLMLVDVWDVDLFCLILAADIPECWLTSVHWCNRMFFSRSRGIAAEGSAFILSIPSTRRFWETTSKSQYGLADHSRTPKVMFLGFWVGHRNYGVDIKLERHMMISSL